MKKNIKFVGMALALCSFALSSCSGTEEQITALLTGLQMRGVTVDELLGVQPQKDERDGVYRIGAWVREGAAGIGTLTYVDPETGVYGALGHPINDSDSGASIPVREGVLYEGELTGVVRGRRGVPGALEGEIVEQAPLGTIEWNDDTGIGGVFIRAAAGNALFPDGIETETASRVRTGRAQLIATVDENGPQLYDIDILRVDADADTRTFQIRVTDEALLKRTGGIVQGMSGSPVQLGEVSAFITVARRVRAWRRN